MKIICPNCKKTQTIAGKYDECFDKQLTCKKCGFETTGFCFSYGDPIEKRPVGAFEELFSVLFGWIGI